MSDEDGVNMMTWITGVAVEKDGRWKLSVRHGRGFCETGKAGVGWMVVVGSQAVG